MRLELREGERLARPVGAQLGELGLDAQLLDRAVGDVLDVLRAVEQAGLQQRAQLEVLAGHVERLAGQLHQLRPVARPQRRVRELLDERQRLEEVVDGPLELDEGVPAAQVLGHALAPGLEVLHLLVHHFHRRLLLYLGPVQVVVLVDGGEHRRVQPVQLLEQVELRLRLLELGVLRDREAEERLAGGVALELALALLVQPLEAAEALARLHRRKAGHAGAVALELLAELHDVDGEHAHVAHEALAEVGLHQAQPLGHVVGLLLELLPRVVEVGHRVRLLLRQVDVVAVEQRVLLLDGAELPVEQRLLLPDLGEELHRHAHVVEVVDLAAEEALHVGHPLRDRVELHLRLLVQVGRVLHLPRGRLVLERQLHRRRLERERADRVARRDARDLRLDDHVLAQLVLEVVERRLRRHELGVPLQLVLLPQEVVLGERVDVLVHLPLRALDGARQQQHDAHDLAVARHHLVDRAARLARLGVRLPHVDVLRAAEDGARALIDRLLDL
jgi:hypothetical protein